MSADPSSRAKEGGDGLRCFVCSVLIPAGSGRYQHGDWVLCVSCHDKQVALSRDKAA